MKIVEFMDLINIESNGESNGNNENEIYSRSNRVIPASVGDKIWSIVENKFPYGGFTSTDILELYEDQYNEPIKLSIISTYLSRYAERGRLIRTRQGKEWVYKMTKQQPMQAQPSSSASLDLPL